MKKKLNKKNQARVTSLIQQAQLSLKQGHIQNAISLFQQALHIQPEQAEILHTLGMIAFKTGVKEKSLHFLQQAVAVEANSAVYLTNLAIVYDECGYPDKAIQCFQQALQLTPDDADIMNSLAVTYLNIKDYDSAFEILTKAIAIAPDSALLHSKLADVHLNLADPALAIDACRTAVQLDPNDSQTHSKLLFLLTFFTHTKPEALLKEHQQWDAIHGEHGRQHQLSHTKPDPDKKRLRIGYVSGDFRRHAVNSFFEPLLQAHDHTQVEIYCYASNEKQDDVSTRLQGYADHWCNIAHANDTMVAQKIRQDKIDILVDLSGHTDGQRLKVFSYKPAPIQATYLGYGTTTGLASIDYWISDNVLHPQDSPELASETIYHLPRCWVSYQAPDQTQQVIAKAIDTPLTYTSFCQFSKYRPALFDCWGRILARSPGARLLLKSKHFDSPMIKERLLAMIGNSCLDLERVIFEPGERFDDYLHAYNQTDIALDTFPRSSGTTAADALWMGRPVVTLAGDRYIQRLASSKVAALGHPEWIAHSEDEYVDIAVALGQDRQKLAALQTQLRDEFKQSALGNAKELARTMETAYQQMWADYCQRYPEN